MWGKSPRSWKIVLHGRLFGGVSVTSSLPNRIRPEVGATKPPIICRLVLLLDPDGPRSVTKEPRAISSDTSETTGASYTFDTRSRVIAVAAPVVKRPPR